MAAHLTSELSGAALAASGGGPKGRNELERLVSCGWAVHRNRAAACERSPPLCSIGKQRDETAAYPGRSGNHTARRTADMNVATPNLASYSPPGSSYGARGTAEATNCLTLAVLRYRSRNTHSNS